MVSGVDLSATWDFVLPKDKENPTIWKLGVLRASITSLIVDKAASGGAFFQTMIWVVRLGLRGWENFKINGKDVAFRAEKENFFGQEADMLVKDLIDAIPIPAITAIAKEIQDKSQLSQIERKN